MRFARSVAPLLIACALVAPAAAQEFTLRVLHTNDVHARYDQTAARGNTCTKPDLDAGRCVGGAARLASKLAELRTPNAIYLDAGDQFQGNLFYTSYKEQVARTFLSMTKVDAFVLGNHEFDDGPAMLAEFLANATFPVISANTDVADEPRLQGKFKSNVVLTVQGQRIGVFGLTTEDTPVTSSPGPTVKFRDPVAVAREQVAALTAQGITKIIALTHRGLAEDLDLAAKVDGIDLIVGGHSHSLLETGNKDAAGPYPMVVKNPSGRDVVVVTAGAFSLHLGQIDVTFDGAGNVVRWEGKPHRLGADVARDPVVQARVDQFAAPLATLRAQVLGAATAELVGDGAICRFQECNLGNLIADALLVATRARGSQVAIMNAGGVRTNIPAGQITLGQVLEVLPFSNTVATVEVSGADLVRALEIGVGRAHDPRASGTGRFPQVAGLRFAWDGGKPEGSRVASVELRRPEGGYRPIDPAETVVVATNNFLRNGGDGYDVFVKGRNAYDYGPNLEDALAELIKRGPVAPVVEGRIRRLDR
jgi:5'-nucleotidase